MTDELDVDDIARWLADVRVTDAAASRARRASLQRLSYEEADLAGTLTDFVERGAEVALCTAGGAVHGGTVMGVGADFCALRTRGDVVVLVRIDAIDSISGTKLREPPTRALEPREQRTTTLGELLAALAGEGRHVRWCARVGRGAGELLAVGADVVTFRREDGGVVYVPVASVTEVSLLGSG